MRRESLKGHDESCPYSADYLRLAVVAVVVVSEEGGQNGSAFLPDGVEGVGVQAQEFQNGGRHLSGFHMPSMLISKTCLILRPPPRSSLGADRGGDGGTKQAEGQHRSKNSLFQRAFSFFV